MTTITRLSRLLIATTFAASTLAAGVVLGASPASAADSGWSVAGVQPSPATTVTLLSKTVTPQFGAYDRPKARAVEVPNATSTWATQTRLWPSNGSVAQQFRVTAASSLLTSAGYFKYTAGYNNSLCLDVLGGRPTEGAPVGIYGCDPNSSNQPNQLWRAVAAGGGWYIVVSKVASDAGWSRVLTAGSDGNLRIATWNGSDSQLFRFYEPVVTKRFSTSFNAGETVSLLRNQACSSPYGVDEHGREGTHSVSDVRYTKGQGDFAVGVIEVAGDTMDIHFRRLLSGPRDVHIDVYCNLAAPE